MKKSGILLLFLSGCLIHSLGQETLRFQSDPALFIQEARVFFGNARPEDTRVVLLKFEDAQKNGLLEENHWIDLARKANALEKMGARPYPDFYLFLNAFYQAAAQSKNRLNFLEWSKYLDKLLIQNQKSLNRIETFLRFTLDFSERGILFRSSAFQWKVKPGINEFGMDSAFFVTINPSDLVVNGSGDSTVIFATAGRYYPETGIFYGQGGRITWERLRIRADQVYVQLKRYKIDLTKSSYSIDSVNLIDKRYFNEPLTGLIENKILPGMNPETAGYPRFTSHELRNRIKNLYPGMDYEGGFSLHGLKVLGTGLPSQKSVVSVFNHQKLLMRLASTYFSFQPDQARGINTEASIYLDTDSIYHPGLLFQYNGKQKELSLIRDGQGLSPSRFLNTYHNYDLNVEQINWHPGDSVMTLTGIFGSTENRASFESSDFFSIDRYNEILIADQMHPVTAVKQCADYFHSRNFTLADLSGYMKKPQHLVEEMLLRLSFLGFVKYSPETMMIEVLERSYDFLKKNAGQQDYDIIRFESVHQPPEANAVLNLATNRLRVFWVKSVELSQVRKITIFPLHETIDLLKDRDILFDGEVQGGQAHFTGSQFRFNYDDFSIRLNKIDQIRLQVYEKPVKKNQEPDLVDVTSVVENTSGILRIDHPTDKSGLKTKEYPDYPILQTDTTAYVYYDQKNILDGIYPRETFFFHISPFTLRGLNLISFKDSLIFPGRFITAGIFPPLELSLRHQSDHSLGFETLKTPEKGYPVYNGKGQFYNSIAMSKAGLKGSGKLEYLNSVLVSENFLFLPDQVNTLASLLSVSKDTTDAGNPETRGELMAVKWYPESDKLLAQGTKGPLSMYGDGKFVGELSLTPTALSGKGTLSFKGYSVTSDTLKFYQDSYDVVNGTLRIFKDLPGKKPETEKVGGRDTVVIAHQYKGSVDVLNQKARFEPEGADSRIAFTRNRFEGKSTSLDWDLAAGQVILESAVFRMAAKPSDTLNFKSGRADFALNDLSIKAHSVDYVDVADVRVFPSDRNLIIRQEAKIDSLTGATIVSRDTSLVHRITRATVTIIDHKNYTASGSYQYSDVAKRDFFITFSDIRPDKNGISFGKGTIPVENNFNLSPAFKYYGSVEWNNNERFLLFDGQTQISHSCPNLSPHWIRFASRVFPDSVAIPIDSVTTNDQGERLFKGFFLSNQPVELYSTFVGPHTRYSDQPLISSSGWLWYDESKGLYKLASGEKKADPEADGPIITFDANACKTEARGLISMGVDLGQVKIGGAGRLVHDLRQDTVKGSVMMTLDFFMDTKILDFMSKSINSAAGLEPVNYGDPAFRESFKGLIGRAKGDELLKQISLTGKWKKIPDELLHTLVFTDIRFKWNPETGSYQSAGKIGISNIMGEPINKKVNGFLEITHRRGGDAVTFYIGIDRQSYFFLTYSRGVMQCVAGPGYEKFNTMIRSTKESRRKQKTEPGEMEYQYYMGTYAQVAEFLRRFSVER